MLEICAIAGIVAGTARPTHWATWKTPLERNSSSNQPLSCGTGFSGPALRLLRLVLVLPVCGNQ